MQKTAARNPAEHRLRVTSKRVRVLGLFAALAVMAAIGASASASSAARQASTGGTLTIATPGAPNGLDPASGSSTQTSYSTWAYDPLIVEEPNGTFAPGLALSWKYGARNKSFSMTLRPHVRFSDGTPFNAQALKTWLQYAMTVAGGGAQAYIKNLTKVAVTGPLSLTLIFNTPTPLLPLVFSQIFTVGMPASAKAVAEKNLATETDGAGQYELDQSQTVAGDHYTYVPNPYYWNKAAVHWKKVVVKVISNPSTVLEAMKTGQVQAAIDQPVSSVAAAKSSGLKAATPLVLMMTLVLADRNGTMAKPLADVRVRQALNYAIDRTAVAKAVGAGYGVPIDQMAVQGDDGYNPALKNAYPYNPDKAKQLLAAAGYPNGFSFSAVATPIVGLDTLGQALVGQFAKIGVTMNLDIKDPGGFGAGVAGAHYPAFTVSWGRLPSPVEYALLWGPSRSFGNPFATSNAEVSKLYYKMIAASAKQEQVLAQQTQKVLVEQAWFVPVFANPLVVLSSPKIAGVNATAQRDVYYAPELQPAS